MAIKGGKFDSVLIQYKLQPVKPQPLPPAVADNIIDGFLWSPGGQSISKSEAQRAIKEKRLPRRFFNSGTRIASRDRASDFEVLQKWLDGEEPFAE